MIKVDEIIQKQKKSVFLEYVKVIVITLLVTYAILYFFQISRVYGTSMLPKYHEGDIVIVEKVFYKNSKPSYNDIVVIDYVNQTKDETFIIKRVIGVGGDHIEIKDNKLYRNGHLIEEEYIKEEMQAKDLSVDIPEGKVFVLGDNRRVSLDSEELGCFDFKKDVIGKVVLEIF